MNGKAVAAGLNFAVERERAFLPPRSPAPQQLAGEEPRWQTGMWYLRIFPSSVTLPWVLCAG